MGIGFTLSTGATTCIEDIKKGAPDGLHFFGLCPLKDRAFAMHLVRRAEVSGFQVLVVTVDVPVCGQRLADTRNKFTIAPHFRLVFI